MAIEKPKMRTYTFQANANVEVPSKLNIACRLAGTDTNTSVEVKEVKEDKKK